jgi:hypothetical protein
MRVVKGGTIGNYRVSISHVANISIILLIINSNLNFTLAMEVNIKHGILGTSKKLARLIQSTDK